MKTKNKCLWGAVALLASVGVANAAHVSTFSIGSSTFNITGFSDGMGGGSSGPLVTDFTGMTGTYAMDIPTSGLWNVAIDMVMELTFPGGGPAQTFTLGSTDLGNHLVSGPSTMWSGIGLLPDMVIPGGPTIAGTTLDFGVNFDSPSLPTGSFGPNASATFNLSGGNIVDLNSFFASKFSGSSIGGSAIITSHMTLTAVPLPMAGLAALPMLAFGGIAARRRKN